MLQARTRVGAAVRLRRSRSARTAAIHMCGNAQTAGCAGFSIVAKAIVAEAGTGAECAAGTGRTSAMNEVLQELSHCDDVSSLESALRAFCSGFGSVSHLDVLSMVGAEKRQAVCLLRLNSPEQERHL